MAKTVSSATAAYASTADVLLRCNAVVLSKMCNLWDVPVDPNTLLTNSALQAALLDASGMIESSCLAGGKYASADLQLLQATTCAGQGLLVRLCVWLAVGLLWASRPDREGDPPKDAEWAADTLEQLASGATIFPFQETADAGHASHHVESVEDVVARRGTVQQARRLFGRRGYEEWR